MIHRTSKKEIRRVKSLRKISPSSPPQGIFFVAPDNKAYVCDTPGIMGVKEMTEFIAMKKEELTAQQELL